MNILKKFKLEFRLIFQPADKMKHYQKLGYVTNKAYSTHIIQEDQGITFL